MMISPNCPDHGRLVLDLALGRLDDGDAARAEDLRTSCPVCREWWQTQFDCDEATTVDDAVTAVFDDLHLPNRRRGRGWMAAAAAVVMALGATALWMAQSPSTEPLAVERSAAIRSMDFEGPEPALASLEVTAAGADETGAQEPVVVPAMVHDAVVEEVVVAEALPVEHQTQPEPEPLFSGGFESGDLSDWVPST